MPGLVYTYTISIEEPADGLIISPESVDTEDITFIPKNVTFNGYKKGSLTF